MKLYERTCSVVVVWVALCMPALPSAKMTPAEDKVYAGV